MKGRSLFKYTNYKESNFEDEFASKDPTDPEAGLYDTADDGDFSDPGEDDVLDG